MAQIEPMDIDNIVNDFDDKENSLHISNVLPRTPCTEKGYEELDVSELNMKLRYSITPASSPISRSYTANCKDNKTFNLDDDSLNNTIINDNANLTRSFNSTITKTDVTKSPKLPLQVLPTDQFLDNMTSLQRPLGNDPNIKITVNGTYNIDENFSLPSTSSSTVQTPEATTPTKDIPKDGGSPIMRGLKSVLNMFRSSQSPIPPEDNTPNEDPVEPHMGEQKSQPVLASTPKGNNKNKDNNSPKRTSPLKDSVVFKDDLERELQWKDDSTIIFKQEKIPIHKLFLQQSTSLALEKKMPSYTDNLNSTVEYMDVSYNDSVVADKTMTDVSNNVINIESASGVESDGEFLDCETTYSKHEHNSEQEINVTLSKDSNELLNKELSKENALLTNEQSVANISNIIKNYSPQAPISVKNDEKCEKQEDLYKILNNVQMNTEFMEETNEKLPTVSSPGNNINLVKDMNITVDLNVSHNTNSRSDNFNDLTNPLMENCCYENNGTKVSKNGQQEFKLPCPENNEIDTEEKRRNVSKLLIIETDNHDSDLLNKDNNSNNLECTQRANIHELSSQNLNSGILQICTSKSENYKDSTCNNGHEHANNALLIGDANVQNTKLNLEENNVVENVTENEIEKDLINVVVDTDVKNLSTAETSHVVETQTLENIISIVTNEEVIVPIEAEMIEDSLKPDDHYFNNQLGAKEIVTNYLNLNNDVQNNVVTNVNTDSKTTEMDFNNVETIGDATKLQDIIAIDLPADVPLPSDDEIEKDNLTTDLTSCVIKNDNEVNDKGVENFAFLSGNKTVNLLEAMDLLCEETVTTNTNISDEISETTLLTKVSNFDVISIENATSSITLPEEVLNNDSKIIQEPPFNNGAKTPFEHTPILNNENDTLQISVIALSEHNMDSLNILEGIKQDLQNTNENQYNLTDTGDLNKLETDIQSNHKLEKRNNTNLNENVITINDVVEIKENKTIDDEIVTSANNSPFVSVNDLNLPKTDVVGDQIESPFETKCKIAGSPPISPKLARRGYNINFDEIDDPFATKTNIRMSPTPEMSPKCLDETVNLSQKNTEVQKKMQPNRRKSQPERQKRDITKKRLNNSYSYGTKSINNRRIEASVGNNAKDEIKMRDENDQTDSNGTTTVLEANNLEPIILNECEIDDLNVINKPAVDCEEPMTNDKEAKLPIGANSSYNKSKLSSESSSKSEFPVKNVFNLPEIDDMNFNPFATKSKMRKTPSPPPTFEKEIIDQMDTTHTDTSNDIIEHPGTANLTINIDTNIHQNKVEITNLSSETCSSRNTDKEFTGREINTEDEDTVEGPFLEAEDFDDVVKETDFAIETDMMQFKDLPTAIDNGNKEDGELFIDAEAFEFLLNQNNSNVIADSGKESLFLKFDPLFAKRVSSDGVLAALNRIQKRQSTPKKLPAPAPINVIDEEKPTASSSNVTTVMEESNDDISATLTKPMMVVNPAINSLVSPRKSTTPPRINRRSLTFTSPAIAVIDRLLSLSGNSSTLDHETTIPRQNREYNDTDIALTQLRELLAEKEIHVHNLRSESKELKGRLATMESQVKTLEMESEERLTKVNELKDFLTEKTKINKSMAVVVEEYERTIASLIAEMEQEKRRNAEEKSKLISERDEQTAHLASMEVSFSDLHSKYEKSKQIILSMKANEDTYKKSIKEFEDNLLKMQNNYELLKQHATSKLNHANQELEKFNRAHDSEVLKLNAMIKRKELHITSLDESLAQKTKANEELTAICDELINKVG